MTSFVWIGLSLFVVSFIFLFFFVKQEESKKDEAAPIQRMLLATGMLALIVTLMFGSFMLVPFFVLVIAERFVDLSTHVSSIVFIGGVVLIYILLFERLLQMVIQRVLKFHAIHQVLFNIVRLFIFLGITTFVSLSLQASVWIALVLTVLFILIDIGDRFFTKKEQPHA